MKKVAIIDYGMGNLRSIEKCLNYLGIENKIIDDPKNLKNFTHIILPGVGSFKKAISNLKKNNMYEAIIKISRNKKKRF